MNYINLSLFSHKITVTIPYITTGFVEEVPEKVALWIDDGSVKIL